MAATLDIPLSITDFAKVMRQFADLQAEIIKTGQVAQQSLNISARGVAGGIRPVTSGAASGGSTGSGGVRFHQGPRQRLPGLNAQMQSALKAGNDAAAGDIYDAIKRAESQIRRTQPRTFGQKFGTFLRSTRFGAGGIEPLIGRTADLLGDGALGELAGPVGLLALGLVKAVGALKDFTLGTNQAAQGFQSTRYGLGTSVQTTGQLSAIAAAIGISPDQIGGAAGNLVGAAQGGYSSIFTSRAGLQTGPSNIFNLDRGGDVLKAIKYIRNAPSDAAAQQFAQVTGTTDLLPARNLSAAQYAKVLAAGGGLAGASGGAQAAQNRLTDSLGNLKTSVDTLTAKIGGKIAGPASTAVDFLTAALSTPPPGTSPNEIRARYFAAHGGIGAATPAPAAPEQHPAVKAMNRLADETSKNTRATQQNTVASVPGRYGNASRADFEGDGMGGMALSRAIKAKYNYQLSPF